METRDSWWAKDLENAFRREVFKMLKAEGRINDFMIEKNTRGGLPPT